MKKIFLIMLMIMGSLLVADIHDITIDGGQYTVMVGDTVRVYVNALEITGEMNVIAFQFDLYYDEENVQFINHKPGDLFENAMLMANGENEGLVKVACSHWQPQSGSGTLVELQFIAKTPGDFHLQFDKFKMNSSSMTKIYDPKIKILSGSESKSKKK